MQDGDDAGRVEVELVDHEAAQLGVAVLFDEEHALVRKHELAHRFGKRKRTHAQGVQMQVLGFQNMDGLVHGRAGRAVVDGTEVGFLPGRAQDRLRHQRLGRIELLQQAFHVVDVIRPALRIARIRITRSASGEVAALGRVGAGIGAIGNAVPINILVAAEIPARFQLLGTHHLAAIVVTRVVPGERRAQALVHADVQIGHDENRGLQAVGKVKGLCGELEALARIFRQQQHMLGVPVRCVGTRQDVRLLGARRHAGGRAAALHVDDGDGDLGEIGQADELIHQ